MIQSLPERMNIALIIGTLRGGGAERILSGMANHWNAKGHKVTLLTHDSREHDFYHLDPGIDRIGLNLTGPTQGPLYTLRQRSLKISESRRIMRRIDPDVAISFTSMTNCETLAALWGTGIPLIVSERNNPTEQKLPVFWRLMRALLYPRAAALVMQTEGAASWARKIVDETRVHTIPNFVEPPSGRVEDTPLGIPQAGRLITAAGRLTRQKGFDLLIEAFSRICRDKADWSLAILGEGDDRGHLQELASRLSLQDRVFLPGRIGTIEPVLRRSDIFVLSSRYEGFPNVLLEAMAVGLPVISTDCPYGPADIVRQGQDGILVPNRNITKLAAALDALMDNEEERKRLSCASTSVLDRFGKDAVMPMWDRLITSAAGYRG